MKIYTKTGDKGQTSLFGGKRVSKGNDRIDAYGTVDELNSFIGLLIAHLNDSRSVQILDQIQNELFIIGSRLASGEQVPDSIPQIKPEKIEILETEIDWINEQIEPLKNFILPQGSKAISFCHVARCVCRRAERATVKLSEYESVEEIIIKYLNRLSDYLFTLARWIAKEEGVKEITWNP